MIAVLLKLVLAGTVCYAGSASPGHSYAMSDAHWVNATSRAETVTFVTNDAWIVPAKTSFTLQPGQSADIPVTLVVPPGAKKGDYIAKLRTASGASQNVMFGVGVRAPCAGPSGPPLPVMKGTSNAVQLLLALVFTAVGGTILYFWRISPVKRTWGRNMKKRDTGVVPPGRNASSSRFRGEYRRHHHDLGRMR